MTSKDDTMPPLRRAIFWLVVPRALPMVFPKYLLWRDVVEINGQPHRFKGLLRRFRDERSLVDYFRRRSSEVR
jgi:hypothetical protein